MTIRTRAAKTVAALPPGLRWRTRNLIALGRWARFRALGRAAPNEAYAEPFWALHSAGDWSGLAALIVRYGAPRSIVDVGCGDGKLLAAIRACDRTIALLGIDSSPSALRLARAMELPVELSDLAPWRTREAARLSATIGRFDVAVSLETAEHLPPWSGPGLVRLLAHAPTVVFSAAHPGQGGTLHMNERPFEYWREQFAACALYLAAFDAPFRAAVAALDLPWWYARNIHVFQRSAE